MFTATIIWGAMALAFVASGISAAQSKEQSEKQKPALALFPALFFFLYLSYKPRT
jgi:ABC-type Co2+ transport system permease subunit